MSCLAARSRSQAGILAGYMDAESFSKALMIQDYRADRPNILFAYCSTSKILSKQVHVAIHAPHSAVSAARTA
jgi:hypothetical protein